MAENIRHLFPDGEPHLLRPGGQRESLESGGGGDDFGGMNGLEELRRDVDGLKKMPSVFGRRWKASKA